MAKIIEFGQNFPGDGNLKTNTEQEQITILERKLEDAD
jgi:hypothetical protein